MVFFQIEMADLSNEILEEMSEILTQKYNIVETLRELSILDYSDIKKIRSFGFFCIRKGSYLKINSNVIPVSFCKGGKEQAIFFFLEKGLLYEGCRTYQLLKYILDQNSLSNNFDTMTNDHTEEVELKEVHNEVVLEEVHEKISSLNEELRGEGVLVQQYDLTNYFEKFKYLFLIIVFVILRFFGFL